MQANENRKSHEAKNDSSRRIREENEFRNRFICLLFLQNSHYINLEESIF